MTTLLLSLLILNLGFAAGAGLYESRVVIPTWIRRTPPMWDPDAARASNSGLRFWAWVTTGPLTILTLANLFAGWSATGEAQAWWLAAALIALLERLLTFGYFIPAMVRLMREDPPHPTAFRRALRWLDMNLIRHALTMTAWIAALRAFYLVA